MRKTEICGAGQEPKKDKDKRIKDEGKAEMMKAENGNQKTRREQPA